MYTYFVSDGGHLGFLHFKGFCEKNYQLNKGSIGFLMSENIQKDSSFMFLCQLFANI